MKNQLKIVESGNEVIATNVSGLTQRTHTRRIKVTKAQIDRWRAGVNIQDAMPGLSASDREFLMTGVVDDEWDAMFGDEFENERGKDKNPTQLKRQLHADAVMLEDEGYQQMLDDKDQPEFGDEDLDDEDIPY